MGYKTSRVQARRQEANDSECTRPPAPSNAPETDRREQTPTADDRRRSEDNFSRADTSLETSAYASRSEGGGETDSRGGYVTYSPTPDRESLSNRYGIDVREGEARKLQRLETEFGSDRVGRWVDEGMAVETMGKPRDMQAFRERRSERSGGTIQPELEVSSPTDPAEKEAEQVARQIVQMDDAPEPQADEAEGRVVGLVRTVPVNRSASAMAVSEESETKVKDAVQGGGQALSPETRSYFEPRFGADFSDVQVHTGSDADEAARSISAKAFTLGSDIAFAKGNYDPGSRSGKELLAHELTHVAQQDGGVLQSSRAVQRQAVTQQTHTVQKGDTLSQIASKYGVPGGWQALAEVNRDVVGDDPHLIHPGDSLSIPGAVEQKDEQTETEMPNEEEKKHQPSEGSSVSNETAEKEGLMEQVLSWVPDKRGVLDDMVKYAASIGISLEQLNKGRAFLTNLVGSVGDIETITRALNTARIMKTVGLSMEAVNDLWDGLLLSPIWSDKSKAANDIIDAVNPSNKFFSFLGKVGKVAGVIGAFFTGWEIGTALREGKWGKAASDAYKFIMGMAVPVASIVDGITGLIHTIFGDVPYVGEVADFLKSINPLALGGVAVDTIVTLIDVAVSAFSGGNVYQKLLALEQRMRENIGGLINLFEALKVYDVLAAGIDTIVTFADMIIEWDLSMDAIHRLVQRYRDYGLGALVDLGEWLGGAAFEAKEVVADAASKAGTAVSDAASGATKLVSDAWSSLW